MSTTIIRGSDAPIEPLRGRRIAVVGFGNQGRAHALNLRDSGLEVVVGSRPDTAGDDRARSCGFEPLPIDEAAGRSDLVVMALPDEVQPEVYAESIAPNLKGGATIGFLHGFNIRYGLIEAAPGIGVVMVAPKGPGATLRALFEQGRGLPSLFAVHRESSAGDAEALGLAWANGIGSARAGIVRTSFEVETETDLFGEQTVLCGGVTALVRCAFQILTEAGYPPELAYLECCHEIKQVADLVYERGLAGMYEAISTTAEFGTYRVLDRLVDESLRGRMRDLLAEIRDGSFARALRDDHEAGAPWMRRMREQARAHPLEPAGEAVRSLMPWLAGAAEQESRQ
jgi:ketol-acid reductoisomerase